MTEAWSPPSIEEVEDREAFTEKKIGNFFKDHPVPDIKKYWVGLKSAQFSFLDAAKVTMTAQNLTDLDFLVKLKLRQYQLGGWYNKAALFTNPGEFYAEEVGEVLESKPMAHATPDIEQSNETAVNLGKFILHNLNNLGDPEKSYSEIQREATRDLAMFRYILAGFGNHVRENLIARYMVFSYVSGLAMRAFEPTVRPETIVMPSSPRPKRTSTGDLLERIDKLAPPNR